jgi:hypothetical protein
MITEREEYLQSFGSLKATKEYFLSDVTETNKYVVYICN